MGVVGQVAQRLGGLAFGMATKDVLALEHLEKRRLRHVEVALLDDRWEIAIEECEQQGADMAAVHVSVSHRDNSVVAHFLDIEVVSNACSHRGDQVAYLV